MYHHVLAPCIIRRAIGGKRLGPVVACVIEKIVAEDTVFVGNALVDSPVGIQAAQRGREIRVPVQGSSAVVRERYPFLEDCVGDGTDPAGGNLVIGECYAGEWIFDGRREDTLALVNGRNRGKYRSDSLDHPGVLERSVYERAIAAVVFR